MRFDRQWFEKHQTHLVRFANSRIGRRFFHTWRAYKIPADFRIMAITTNAVCGDYRVADGKLHKTWVFGTGDYYAGCFEKAYAFLVKFLPPIVAWKIAEPAAFLFPFLAIASTEFNTESGDGYVMKDEAGFDTWANIRGAASGSASTSDAGATCATLWSGTSSNTWRRIARGHFGFGTAALDDAETISVAVFSLFCYTGGTSDGFNQALGVVESTMASNTTPVGDDYNNFGTTRFASDIDIGSITENAYNDFNLNASGIAAINKTGYTKFCTRLSGDIDNAEPTWSSNVFVSVGVRYQNNGSNLPKLVVTVATAHVKTVEEVITTTSSVVKKPVKDLTNTITTTASVVRATVKVLADTIVATTAGTTVVRIVYIIVQDTITTVSSVVRAITKVLSNTVTGTASVNKSLARTISDTATATDSVVKKPVKVASDSITATDFITKLLNGMSTIWTNATKSTSTWTAAAKAVTNWINGTKSS